MPRKDSRPVLREGFDGCEHYTRERPIPGTRQVQQTVMRCREGTFEDFYAKAPDGSHAAALYQGGVEFGHKWEAAGLDGPHGVAWEQSGVVPWRGISDTCADALDVVMDLTRRLGTEATARLVRYVVQQVFIAHDHRELLEADLCEVARHFGYLGRAA